MRPVPKRRLAGAYAVLLEKFAEPFELTLQLGTERGRHSSKQKSFGSLPNGETYGLGESGAVCVPELLLVGVHSIQDLQARLQLLDGQRGHFPIDARVHKL